MADFMLREVLETLIVVAGIVLVAYSPIFRAFGKRIMHGRVPPEGMPLTVDDARMDQISGEVAALRRHLDETLDRLEFTERMLAQAQARGVLGAPKGS